MNDFKIGDLVDVTIKGVRVTRPRTATSVTILDEHDCPFTMPPQAEVERVAPAEWPPQPGDLWRDRKGDVWFGRRYIADPDVNADWEGCNDDGWRPVLTPLDGGPYGYSSKRPDDVLREFGPLTLVRREDEQIGGAS